jgi:alpha-mannosidase
MQKTITRRDFVKASLVGGMYASLPWARARFQATTTSRESVCVTLCNHWSYIGIGWQLGIESCVLSATDAMEMADRAPHVKTCINMDARAYEFMAEKFPDVASKLREYLAAGKIELIGGTYGQPMGTMFSGESNIRQLVYGRETIRKALGYEMVTFLEEEEFSHPQIPQIALGAGYRYASLAQLDTWGRAGAPLLEVNSFLWKGKDGATLLSTPKNSLFGNAPDPKYLATSDTFKKLRAAGKPLFFAWAEFGWEPPDQPSYLKTSADYRQLAEESPVEFVSLKEYLDKYGSGGRQPVYFNMDAWTKLLTWGVGGDQLRIMDRKVERTLHAAERFDAIASSLGARSKTHQLDAAWKHLLASQSHDVGLCEYSRWQGDRMAPLDRVEDQHNLTWGAIGYRHLDSAQSLAQEVLDASLGAVVGHVGSSPEKHGQLAVTVFNSCGWERTDVASTGRIYPIRERAKGIVVKDRSGRAVPSQIIKSDQDRQGNLTVAEVAFKAEKIPSVGYDTFYLEFTPEASKPLPTDLRIDEQRLELENEFLKVRLGANHGAIVSLVDKRTGQEFIDGEKSAFPVFKGTPNQEFKIKSYFLRAKYSKEHLSIPEFFDSAKSVTDYNDAKKESASSEATDWQVVSRFGIRWIEKGPLRATLKASHSWPLLKFETCVTLTAGMPFVEVVSRVLVDVPPALDKVNENGRFPLEIKKGYWLNLAPAFPATSVIRDFPLGIEPTKHKAFHALSFVDLVGKDAGLLILHPGTQYFKCEEDGVISNLIMREWESYWTGEYGWPRYSEYHHALVPHRGNLSNADRRRAADAFGQRLFTVCGPPRIGDLPKRKGFVTVKPKGAHLLAFRKKEGQGMEVRVVEVEGEKQAACVELAVPTSKTAETDLLGKKIGETLSQAGKLNFELKPWKVRTFEVV